MCCQTEIILLKICDSDDEEVGRQMKLPNNSETKKITLKRMSHALECLNIIIVKAQEAIDITFVQELHFPHLGQTLPPKVYVKHRLIVLYLLPSQARS